jgi:hypothetical protein
MNFMLKLWIYLQTTFASEMYVAEAVIYVRWWTPEGKKSLINEVDTHKLTEWRADEELKF